MWLVHVAQSATSHTAQQWRLGLCAFVNTSVQQLPAILYHHCIPTGVHLVSLSSISFYIPLLFFSTLNLSMSRRTSTMASSNSPPTGDGGKLWSLPHSQLKATRNSRITGQEKQKMLLSAETGHFSMIRSVSCNSTAARLVVFAHFKFVL